MSIWGVVRIAATKVPWGRVMENVPALMDMVQRAKGRLREQPAARGSADERLRALEEENLKLGKALVQSSETIKQLAKTVEVVTARQKMLMTATVISFLMALTSLLLWL